MQNVKNFDMFLFVFSITTMLYQMKKGNRRKDIIDSILTYVLTNYFIRLVEAVD